MHNTYTSQLSSPLAHTQRAQLQTWAHPIMTSNHLISMMLSVVHPLAVYWLGSSTHIQCARTSSTISIHNKHTSRVKQLSITERMAELCMQEQYCRVLTGYTCASCDSTRLTNKACSLRCSSALLVGGMWLCTSLHERSHHLY